MIKFFRVIRQKLLKENKIPTYLTYALGEIFLVVIGILIALQINNWNESRKESIKEIEILIEVLETLKSNAQLLNQTILSIKNRAHSGELVYSFLKSKDGNINISPEDWHWALISRGDLQLSMSGYEILKNNGSEIIKNSVVKKAIVDLFENKYAKLKREQRWGDVVRPDYDKFILEHFIKNHDEKGKIKFGLIPRNKEVLLNSHYYFGLIETAIGQKNFYAANYQRVLEEGNIVMGLIEEELDR